MPKWNKYYLLIAIVIALLSLLIIFGFNSATKSVKKTALISQPTSENQTSNTNINPVTSPVISSSPDNKPIVKVGSEIIYQKDLNAELSLYPDKSASASQKLIQKLIEDSKIIQHGAEIGLVQPDNSVYNSPNKDYPKRTAEVRKIKETIQNNDYTIKGSGVSIWFLNDRVGPLGIEKARELAFNKIRTLYKAVKEKTMTIEQAAENIKNDSSLSQLDKNYKGNAFFSFSIVPGKRFTYEENFDKTVWQLNAGDLTQIYTASSKDFADNQVKPAYFMFAQVSEKLEKPRVGTVDNNKYEVTFF